MILNEVTIAHVNHIFDKIFEAGEIHAMLLDAMGEEDAADAYLAKHIALHDQILAAHGEVLIALRNDDEQRARIKWEEMQERMEECRLLAFNMVANMIERGRHL